MVRIATTNYAGTVDTTFEWATVGTDRFSRLLDLYRLSQALEQHTHAASKGLAVARVANASIGTAQLASGAVDASKLGTDAVTAVAVALDAIGALELANNAVDTAAILNLAVTTAKLADLGVTTAKIADGNVTTAKITDANVTAIKLAAGAVTGNLGYVPINPAGGTMTGQLRVFRTQGAASGAFDAAPLVVQSPDAVANPAETAGIGFHRTNSSGIYLFHGGPLAADLLRFITNGGVFGNVFSSQNMGAGSGLDAASVITKVPTATPSASAIPIADGSAKLDGWITAGTAGVPAGFGGWVRTAAEVPSGYTRESNLDGRFPIGAGTAGAGGLAVTYVEATNYGTSWSFIPSDAGHSHGMGAAGVTGSSGSPSATDNATTATGGGTHGDATNTHTHNQGSYDVTGSSDTGSAAMSATTWTIPARGVVWVRKN